MKDAVADMAPFDDPVPPGRDAISICSRSCSTTTTRPTWTSTARDGRKLFAALKPGGYLVIADHSALPGQGISVDKTLHRIEEATLRKEVEAAGFKLVAEGNFWRQPDRHARLRRATSRTCRSTISC